MGFLLEQINKQIQSSFHSFVRLKIEAFKNMMYYFVLSSTKFREKSRKSSFSGDHYLLFRTKVRAKPIFIAAEMFQHLRITGNNVGGTIRRACLTICSQFHEHRPVSTRPQPMLSCQLNVYSTIITFDWPVCYCQHS